MAINAPPNLTMNQHQIMQMYLAGIHPREIARQLGLNTTNVYYHLRNPIIKAVMAEKIKQLDIQVMDFKIRAIEGAHAALDTLTNLAEHAKDEGVRRASAKDVIEIAGLMPQKRVLMQGEITHGIDQDTMNFYNEVVAEMEQFTEQDEAQP